MLGVTGMACTFNPMRLCSVPQRFIRGQALQCSCGGADSEVSACAAMVLDNPSR